MSIKFCGECGAHNHIAARFCQTCGSKLQEKVEEQVTRRRATVVFCDLVESTALGEAMDPEVLRQVIRGYFDRMKEVLTSYGGTVEKFIGDAVVGAFGIPTLHEDDPLRAVSAAVEMTGSIEEMNSDLRAQWGVSLDVRIGVNTGEVMAGGSGEGHGFMSGDAINVAARLQQNADPGQILIGAETYNFVRDAVTIDDLGPLELKGKSAPIAAYAVRDVTQGALGRSRRLDSELVGRDKELTALKEALARACETNAPSAVRLLGLAGAGKSRLAEEFVRVTGEQVTILRATFLPYGQTGTLTPIAQTLRQHLDIGDEDTVEVATRAIADALGTPDPYDPVVARILSLLGLAEDASDLQDVFWAVRKLLENLGGKRPIALLLDDLQWAQATALELIEYLATFAKTPLLLLCISRVQLVDEQPWWTRDVETISLDRLANDEITLLTRNLLDGNELPGHFERRIAELAEGNPLFVEEVIRGWIDAGILERDDRGWKLSRGVSEVAIPPTIDALVAARLERLEPEERTLLETAAIVGRRFWWKALASLLPAEARSGIAQHLQALMRKEFIEPDPASPVDDDAFRFKHGVVRETAYQGLSKRSRSELHESFAAWLEPRADSDGWLQDLLAYHCEQAFLLKKDLRTSTDTTDALGRRAAGLLGSAAERALESADVQAAANALRRATRLQPAGEEGAIQLSIKFAGALMECGEFEEASAELERTSRRALDSEWHELWAQAELQRLLLHNHLGIGDEGEEGLFQLEALLPCFEDKNDTIWVSRAEYLRANLLWDRYQLGAAETALDRALDAARKADSHQDIARTLGSLTAVLLLGPHPVDDAIARCEEIIHLSSDHLLVKAKALLRLGGLNAMRKDFTAARKLVSDGRHLLSELGQEFSVAASSHEAGMVEVLADDQVAAEHEFRKGIDQLKLMGEKATLASSAAYLARALYSQDRLEEALEWTATSQTAWGDHPYGIVEWGPTRAKVLARTGHLDAAEDIARAAVVPMKDSDDVLARAHVYIGLADVLILEGKTTEALPLLNEAHELYVGKGVLPLADKVRDRLGSWVAA